ncbi:quinoprotein dehydrogenase-associated SoxYZ-like carrier [Parasalinivibrio latis]|uniref:quinoprotein dehydrogenase-associated SoxYZ-like carrier n=1 Tax=Parasalinivibrio latis TaxID=2952610 RepID=UPI0030E3120A
MKFITHPLAVLLLFLLPAGITTAASPSAEKSVNWPGIKNMLFPMDPEIIEDNLITLVTPPRAEDAALVPVTIRFSRNQADPAFIRKIHLVVDNNPSPVVGTFTMTRENGIADISTRIRVNAYSHVRAIAETADGTLHMTTNYVKASGGCSAPAGADDELAKKRMGKMKLRSQFENDIRSLQLLVSHPNYSGLQIDQITRLWIPSDYVNQVNVTMNSQQVMSFTGGISISENPSFTFHLDPSQKGELKAEVKDSSGRAFAQSWAVQ